jgi:ATP-dependent DNA helicase RecQ
MSAPHEILKQYWAYDEFRPLQLDIINSVLEGRDTLALLPTGGGKSICFQVPAMCREGLCLVISPLIALMKDQVEHLRDKDIRAAALHSGMSRREIETILNNAVNGAYKFLYLSPERLQNENTRDKIAAMNINLLAIDEAHCISQWGYDFRPEYLQIANIREIIPNVPLLALTASATTEVVTDIQAKLLFHQTNVFRKSFERKNLQYMVRETDNKFNKLLEICHKSKGSGLIYTRNRRLTQEIANWLQANNISSAYYHAGMSNYERNKIQEEWILNKKRVVVCTNAFGMGIDKPDVRFVIHYQMPSSLEAYYQEGGRAGRDGNKSYCVVLHHTTDDTDAKKLLEQKYVSKQEVKTIYELLCNYLRVPVSEGFEQVYDFNISDFCRTTQTQAIIVTSALKILEQNNALMATQALYNPSKIQLITDSQTLYNYQLKNENHNEIIKSLVRSYGGLFDYYVNINETEIASKTQKATPAEVVECLQYLHQLQYADYIPQSDSPKLIFLSPRLSITNLQIDEEMSTHLKKIEQAKLNAAIHYATQNSQCRSREILKYFDELKTFPCGVCDVCLGYFRKDLPEEKFNQIQSEIFRLLKIKPLKPEVLVSKLGFSKQQVDIVIRFLFANELIKYNKANEIAEN